MGSQPGNGSRDASRETTCIETYCLAAWNRLQQDTQEGMGYAEVQPERRGFRNRNVEWPFRGSALLDTDFGPI